ncbi:MAG: leucyl aminopeptidase [Desulfobulbaceae bacterium]|jgi:leucyl aminopeptidase|nr:leucyl aminopeptidase [Desulfobulbaceae bacterium]
MKDTKVRLTRQAANTVETDLLVFWLDKEASEAGDLPPFLADGLAPHLAAGDFPKKEGETALFYSQDCAAKRILAISVDLAADDIKESFRQAGGLVAKQCARLRAPTVAVAIGKNGLGVSLGESLDQGLVQSLVEGVMLGDYRFGKYKTEDKEEYQGIKSLTLIAPAVTETLKAAASRGRVAARAACLARDLAREPGNQWTAKHFAAYAEKLRKRDNLKCRILGKKELKELKMGGILAVNQGSAEAPRLVLLDWQPENFSKTIMLVGKGLTFDSGGISLKPSDGMHDMRYDMCGGAVVLAVMEAVAEEQPAARVVGLIPATDNMPDGGALKPGDVVTHYNGLTSEIISTDAEGRMILADALAWGIETCHPDCVIDIATLTGAAVIALGHHEAPLFSTADKLAAALQQAAAAAAEPLWPMPLHPAYKKQIKSEIADIKNVGGRPGGSCTAAAYLRHFVGDIPWAHIDIAGTAWEFTEKEYVPKGPSGFGVRLLLEFIRAEAA